MLSWWQSCSPLKVKVLHYKGREEEAEADLRLGDIYSRAFHGQVEMIGADPRQPDPKSDSLWGPFSEPRMAELGKF